MEQILAKLDAGQDLTGKEAADAMQKIMSGKVSDEEIKMFLLGLKEKGETAGEITAFAKVLRKFATRVTIEPKSLADSLVDTCGSGGDGVKTFNISTAAAFVAAGAGVPVAKHGNRAVSSSSGSADVLEKLGVKIDLGPEGVIRCIKNAGIGFMFARSYHGAMKHVAEARKQLATRTVFNILGPIISPAEVKRQVLGVYDAELTEKLARVLHELGVEHAMVVHGMDGLDEISTLGETKVSELRGGSILTFFLKPEGVGLRKAKPADLKGGTPEGNADVIKRILSGKEKGAKRDIVVLNAAAAIYVGGKAKSLKDGIVLAEKSIDSGKALRALEKLVEVSNP